MLKQKLHGKPINQILPLFLKVNHSTFFVIFQKRIVIIFIITIWNAIRIIFTLIILFLFKQMILFHLLFS